MTRMREEASELEIARRDPAVIVLAHPHDGSRMLYAESLLFLTQYRVIEASNGRQTLERIRRHRPKVAVLSPSLPDFDARAVIRALKDEPSTRDVRVLVIAAHDDLPADSQRIVEAGVDDLLVEPMMPSELVARVSRAVAIRRDDRR